MQVEQLSSESLQHTSLSMILTVTFSQEAKYSLIFLHLIFLMFSSPHLYALHIYMLLCCYCIVGSNHVFAKNGQLHIVNATNTTTANITKTATTPNQSFKSRLSEKG